MVKLTILLSFLSLALATAAKPQLFTSSEPVEVHYDKSVPEPVKRWTNAERLADGLGPAMPRTIGNLLPRRSHREGRTKNYRRQAPPTVSARPPSINNRPLSTAPIAQYISGSDDSFVTINLPFQVQIYDTLASTLYVSSNGWISTTSDRITTFTNTPLPNGVIQGAAIFAYWDDLYVLGTSQDNIFVEATATSLIIRWGIRRLGGSAPPTDFTLTYSTAQPGVWLIFYDDVPAALGSATVGAQASSASSVNSPRASITYTYNTVGSTFPGLRLAITTSADGTSSIESAGSAP